MQDIVRESGDHSLVIEVVRLWVSKDTVDGLDKGKERLNDIGKTKLGLGLGELPIIELRKWHVAHFLGQGTSGSRRRYAGAAPQMRASRHNR